MISCFSALLHPRTGAVRGRVFVALTLLVLIAPFSRADDLSDGRALAAELLAQQPTKNYTATGTLEIRDGNGTKTELPAKIETFVTATNWETVYQAGEAGKRYLLTIQHAAGQPEACFYTTNSGTVSPADGVTGKLSAEQLMTPFAGSDFWVADLSLEFFHWPQQKLLRKEIKRSRGCSVLESTNPHPSAGGYSRVVSWIDSETGGIVQAKAYDTQNEVLKEFYPKDFNKDKVSHEWRVGMMEMDNDQTDSRSRLELDSSPK